MFVKMSFKNIRAPSWWVIPVWFGVGAVDLVWNFAGPVGCLMVAGMLCRRVCERSARATTWILIVSSCAFMLAATVTHFPEAESLATRSLVILVALALAIDYRRSRSGPTVAGPADQRSTTGGSAGLALTVHGSHGWASPEVDTSHHTEPKIPLRLRLIDAGLFPTKHVDAIVHCVRGASSYLEGIKECVKEGLLTSFQYQEIRRGRERQLRVGPYVIEEEVGRGAMGTVYRAFDRNQRHAVALKLFKDHLRNLVNIRREMSVIEELAHPNIVTAFEAGDADGRHYISMEFVDGEDLLRVVTSSGPISESQACRYALQVAHALEQAHDRDILHRDVKPGNIMITRDGNCKLADMGVSRPPASLREHESYYEDVQQFVGTVEFAAPEQAILGRTVDHRSDIFGLGATLFYCLTGDFYVHGKNSDERLRRLTDAPSFRDLGDYAIAPDVKSILSKSLARNPDDRYQSIRFMSAELESAAARMGEQAYDRGIPVLVVEDDIEEYRLTKLLLSRGNRALEISNAPTWKEARDHIIAHCDTCQAQTLVVLLDLNLPDSSPDQSIRNMHELLAAGVKLIAFTGDTDPRTRARCLAAGAHAFMPKLDSTSKELERVIFTTLCRESAQP